MITITPTESGGLSRQQLVRDRQTSHQNSQKRTLRKHELSFYHLLFTIAPKKEGIMEPSHKQRNISSSIHKGKVCRQQLDVVASSRGEEVTLMSPARNLDKLAVYQTSSQCTGESEKSDQLQTKYLPLTMALHSALTAALRLLPRFCEVSEA